MSILTLLITFLGSLFKSHRQLALENLALRQSVKRPRATTADKLFCSKRDVNKRKESTKHPDALDEPDAWHESQGLVEHMARTSKALTLTISNRAISLWWLSTRTTRLTPGA